MSGESDVDNDRVDDFIEDGVPSLGSGGTGDGNGDGIPDSEQANVASLPNSTDGAYLTLATSEDLILTNVYATTPPASSPEGLILHQGLLAFDIKDLTPGSAISLTLVIHGGTLPTTYWKLGPTPDDSSAHWYSFNYDGSTGAQISGKVVTLYFVDGQRGDADLTANGMIQDPGGPAIFAVYLPQVQSRGAGAPQR